MKRHRVRAPDGHYCKPRKAKAWRRYEEWVAKRWFRRFEHDAHYRWALAGLIALRREEADAEFVGAISKVFRSSPPLESYFSEPIFPELLMPVKTRTRAELLELFPPRKR